MRKRFEQQLSLGVIPIGDVVLNLKTRHQTAKIFLGLQHLFTHPELSEAAFNILEEKILAGKKATGRMGMSLWEVLVLGVIRLSLDIDYDFLLDQANHHEELRGILGVGKSDFTKGKIYKYQTVLDNVSLLDEETIKQINDLVVQAGHQLIKKKEGVGVIDLEVKVDSYVVETNVHFPTDLNLLWDCGRKSLDMIQDLQEELGVLMGWREREDWRKKLKSAYRNSSEIHRKKGKNYQSRLESYVAEYLLVANKISEKANITVLDLEKRDLSLKAEVILVALKYYDFLLVKHIALVNRRILQGEKIPHEEKLFSIFEPHTCWVTKGKSGRSVELGVPVLIATDQYNFIIDHEVMYDEDKKKKQSDTDLTQSIGVLIKEKFLKEQGKLEGLEKEEGYRLLSISYDRGFYSGPAKVALQKLYDEVILPKPGKKSLAIEQEESQPVFQGLKRKHSIIEANINHLEQHGVNQCPDKGLDGFKRYVALGALSYNLQQLGKILMMQQKEKLKKSKKIRATKSSESVKERRA